MKVRECRYRAHPVQVPELQSRTEFALRKVINQCQYARRAVFCRYLGSRAVAIRRVGALNNAPGCNSASQPRIVEVQSAPTSAPTLSVGQVPQRKNSGSWSTVYNSSGTSTVRSGSTGHYEYRALACNAAGCGPWSGIKSVYVQQMGGCLPGSGPCNNPDSLPADPPEEW